MPQDSTKLAQLHDIVYPEPVSWFPQTIGWYIIFGLLLLFALWICYRIYKYHKANRYRKEALNELELIKQELSIPDRWELAISQLPVLVKRTVLAWAPREKVAPLHGNQWLEFLDRTYKTGTFTGSNGEQFADLALRKPARDNVDSKSFEHLIETIREWIKYHEQIELKYEES